MSKFTLLLKQLYKQKLKSKAFLLSTGFYLVLISGFIFWSDIKALFNDSDSAADVVAVYNQTGANIEEYFTDTTDMEFKEINSLDKIEGALEDGDYLAAIELSDVEGKLAAQFYSYEPLKFSLQQDLTTQVETAGQLYAISQMNLSAEQTKLLMDTTPIISMKAFNNEESGKTADEKMAGMLGSYAAGIIIYIIVISFLSIITTDVASEKGSRALEMLLVSVKPETHFKSKVFGTFLVAITQLVVLIGAVLLLTSLKDGGELWSKITDYLNELSASYYIFVVAFLILSILLYLIIGALFGSLVSKVEESSQVMMPAMIVIIAAFYVMIAGMNNPDTILIKIFSYIPFTSGMVMPMRMGGTDISIVPPLISLAVLAVTVAALYYISITFYKRSVLTYSTGGVIQKIKTVLKVTT
ncbi:ABC transporter permease [Lysinibacillus odysseyi]|uniref:Sodium ABC transporter permease n=1 Tax=Lysinibacillus odysseyi 34hs-1 = NBRC 100172 TaxID=1220589 RepID=A0A0A3IFI1_9BACI|nr:ABC transporter permease [Lysinibacillus odysseyi]KGR82215.1 sodium ABC transporter permease [Lysinibacillus odysseyi 34hs-1 = NBRC 100172]